MSEKNPIRALNAEVARKIAAGEVIDRPNAIVRELMDNAVDSNASSITVEISGGGIEKIRIIDDGVGMTKEDLSTCAHPHCTSKIQTDEDLLNLCTLGFRGEALASIAAVSRLSIISDGYKMRSSITEDNIIEPYSEIIGTIVQSEGLFENFPARRQFLKRPQSETLMCKQTFIEKSLPRPDISFKFISDGETKIDLRKGETLSERFVRAMGFRENEKLFYEINSNDGEGNWEFSVIIGEPSVNRTNKKDIYIFVNGRRIQEYSLVQAVEYGAQGFFPNGTFPVAAVFVKIKPNLVDFNIHPAKKEAKFVDISSLHHGLSSSIRNFFKNYTISNLASNALGESPEKIQTENLFEIKDNYSGFPTHKFISFRENKTDRNTFSIAKNISTSTTKKTEFDNPHKFMANIATEYFAEKNITNNSENEIAREETSIKFLGCTLGTFLVAEKNGSLFIIDQHAAHERILFNKIMSEKQNKIPLIIPYTLETENEAESKYIEEISEKLSEAGFEISKSNINLYEITTTPDRWKGTEKDLRDAILSKKLEPDEIIRSVAAMTACKAAVKDGYVLDDITAAKIAEEALTLTDPHCPHGRPIYTELSREKLFFLVKRT